MKTSLPIICLLLLCAALVENFYFAPGFMETQKEEQQSADFMSETYKGIMAMYEGYDKPVVWRVMTQKERQDYQRKEIEERGFPSFQALDICLINNFGRAVANPLNGEVHTSPCEGKLLKKWITDTNKKEKEAFEKTGHCVDYLFWQQQQKQAEAEAQVKKNNADFIISLKRLFSFIGIFLFFLILWKSVCFVFNTWDKKRKNGVRKQHGKKYLDLTNTEEK